MSYDDREVALDHPLNLRNGEVRCGLCHRTISKPIAGRTDLRRLALLTCEHDCDPSPAGSEVTPDA